MNVIERFMQLLLEQEDDQNLTPIVQHGDVAFIYIKHTNVYSKNNLIILKFQIYLFMLYK